MRNASPHLAELYNSGVEESVQLQIVHIPVRMAQEEKHDLGVGDPKNPQIPNYTTFMSQHDEDVGYYQAWCIQMLNGFSSRPVSFDGELNVLEGDESSSTLTLPQSNAVTLAASFVISVAEWATNQC